MTGPPSCEWRPETRPSHPSRPARNGHDIRLTAKEFALLEYFMHNRGRIVTREMAEDHIWSYDFQASSNVGTFTFAGSGARLMTHSRPSCLKRSAVQATVWSIRIRPNEHPTGQPLGGVWGTSSAASASG